MLETLWRDLRHGALMLVRNPGFAAVAMLSIAVGVGANAAMFSVADGLVLRPLPVASPGRILSIMATSTGTGFRNPNLSAAEYVDVRDRSRSFDGVVAYTLAPASFAVSREQTAQRKVGMAVSGNLFDAMGVRPAYGRAFRADEDQAGRPVPVVVLDHDEWVRSFGSNPGVVGSNIRIGGMDFTVIGVAPRGFTSIDHDVQPAFYVPLAAWTSVLPGLPLDVHTSREGPARLLAVKARLKPGLTVEQARADVSQIAANLRQAYPDTDQDRGFIARTELDALTYARSDAPMVMMLMAVALAVLIVACANVGGLLISRAPARARDIAMRLAIGARRAQVVRRLMVEGLLMAVGGAIAGLGLAYAAIGVFQRLEFPTDVPLKLTFALDLRAFTVGAAAALACALLASLIPAWMASRTDLVQVFKGDGSSRLPRQWGRQVLVGGQIAVALVLLTVGIFLYRAFAFELDRGPGFRTDHLLMAVFEPGLARYDGDRAGRFYRQVKERMLALPGVRSATWTSAVPMKPGNFEQTLVAPEGFQFAPGTQNVPVLWAQIDEHYFDTMAVPIVRGRAFRPTDEEAAPLIAIVNETMARRVLARPGRCRQTRASGFTGRRLGRDRRRGPRQQERVHRDGPAGDAVRAPPAAPQRRADAAGAHGRRIGIGGRPDPRHRPLAGRGHAGLRRPHDGRLLLLARHLHRAAPFGQRGRDGSDGRHPGCRRAVWPGGLCGQPPHARDRHPHGDRRPAAGGAAHGARLRIRAVDLRPRGRGRWQPGDGPPAASRAQRPRTRRRRRRRRHDADRRDLCWCR